VLPARGRIANREEHPRHTKVPGREVDATTADAPQFGQKVRSLDMVHRLWNRYRIFRGTGKLFLDGG
jgi:hypothetical protein